MGVSLCHIERKKAAEIEEKWYENGDEIAAFLSRINPYIIKDKFQAMFHEHLDMIRLEFQYMLSEDFKTTVKVSDEMVIEALEMADYLTWAISKQFSNEFIESKLSAKYLVEEKRFNVFSCAT